MNTTPEMNAVTARNLGRLSAPLWRRAAGLPFVAALLVCLLVFAASAARAALDFTLSPVAGTVTQGGSAVYRATVKNTGTTPVRLNQISVTFDDGDQADIDPTAFYDNFEGVLAPGASVALNALFSVTAEPTATPATYNGVVQILGGADGDALDNLAQRDFSLQITANAAPPDTFITEGPDNNGVSGIPEVTFGYTGTDSETPTSQLRYRWRLDNGAWKETSETRVKLTNLSYATHTFAVAAVDAANIADPTPVERTFIIEKPKLIVAAPDINALKLIPNQPQTVTIRLTNLSKLTLTNVKAIIQGAASNIVITPGTLPQTLGPESGADVTLTVNATNDQILTSKPTVTLKSAENEEGLIFFDLTIIPQRPQLVLNPLTLNASMLRGQQTLVETELSNTGNVAAANVKIVLPGSPWMTLVSPATFARIEPGQSVKVTLSLLPTADLPLGIYNGNLAVNGDSGGASLPFAFKAVTLNKGTARIVAQDEYTFFAQDKPRVDGAKVYLRDPQTGEIIAEGVTGTTTGGVSGQSDEPGVAIINNVPEGPYNVQVVAEKHEDSNTTLEIAADAVREHFAFLARNLVTYTWNVVPVDTEDKYEITLEATFETHVPAPVVTISPAYVDLEKLSFDENGKTIIYFTVTNHGLIAANKVVLNLQGDSNYKVNVPTTDFGTLPALTTILIPVTITKTSGLRGADADCGSIRLALQFCYICSEEKCREILASLRYGQCISYPIPGNFGFGGGFISGGGASISPPVNYDYEPTKCNPCLDNLKTAWAKCFINCIPYVSNVFDAKDCWNTLNDKSDTGRLWNCVVKPTIGIVCTLAETATLIAEGVCCPLQYLICIGEECLKGDDGKRIAVLSYQDNNAPIRRRFGPRVAEPNYFHMQGSGATGFAYLRVLYHRLQTYWDIYGELLGTSVWFDVWTEADRIALLNWLEVFAKTSNPTSEQGVTITADEASLLRNTTIPSRVKASDVESAINRWNRTVTYNGQGIFKTTDLKTGQSDNFVATDRLLDKYRIAEQAVKDTIGEGFKSIGDAMYQTVKAMVGGNGQ